MASANFNTKIVSSNSEEKLEYNLDVVITKDFEGSPKYNYTLDISATPDGVVIESRQNLGTYLIIPSLVEFELLITVSNGDRFDPIKAKATTKVTIEGKPNFSNEITKFFDNENYRKNKEELVGNWSSIISERISGGDLVDGPVKPI
jgi:hypothetical protein